MSFSTLPESPIPILNSIPACRAWRQTAFDRKKTVGFVPTMGALHDGHLSLVRRSLHENDLTVVSIFVNPAQFSPQEDLGTYPRTLPADLKQLTKQQVNVLDDVRTPSAVFLPGIQGMYPSGISQDVSLQKGTFVEVKGYSHQMEGISRPHFLRGVATIVTKLFNVVQPTNAYFGQKDIQQALLLRRMCRDLLLANPEADRVHIVPTERDTVDGLALSSRNTYLSTEERSVANTLYRALQAAESGWLAGETKDACIRAAEVLVTGAVRGAASRGIDMKLEYIQMNDSDTFEVLDGRSQRQSVVGGSPVILSGAIWVGRTRLIDNIVVGELGYTVRLPVAVYTHHLETMRESRIRLRTGTLPSPQLERLATSHPFVQQVYRHRLPIAYRAGSRVHVPETTYSTAQFTLSELYEYASDLSIPNVSFKALPIQCDADDMWCIDPRGILTLSVSKCLYEKLGMVGKKLPFKGCPERYVIHVMLKHETTSVVVQARQRAAVGAWDGVRAVEGLGRWRVAYVGASAPSTSTSASASVDDPEAYTVKDVTARVRHEADVYVPHVGDLTQSTEEANAEDHQERLEALFEWVGMACLGAQRLHANDRVDPYVAVYETPSPASIDDVTHLRWKGLMDSTFVRSVIDTAISVLSTPKLKSNGDDDHFISITLQSNLMTPVSYMPESPAKEAPPRVPSAEAEDTICLILSKTSNESTWAMGQSIGKWDARWG
ncbi:Pantoate-beta-alanine ligase-domain-containing protein [Lanmaoa asiatica]|nr:Pantoate-beta-alanine ligase-domain-containing protein [Lanmaoa asiatica]